jgi:uncharacterized damage-inducible protein DinB
LNAELGTRLEASREALMEAISGLDEEGFRARPAPGEWSPAETLAHLLLDETKLLEYARAAAEGDTIAVPRATEDERDRQAREAARMPVPQIIHGLLATRRDTTALLERLTDEQLGTAVQHPAYGEAPLGRLFQHMAEQEEEHANQIRTIRQRTARNPRRANAL